MPTTEVNRLTCEQELELIKEKVDELEAALRKETEFKTASRLPLPTMFWLYARDMKDFFLAAKAAIGKANSEPRFNPEEHENRKIIFEVEMHSGEVKGCHLED
jgi:hypothetical protein